MGTSLYGRPRRQACAIVRAREPNCWICGHPIDMTLNHQTDPWGSTVDEVIPRSQGGSTTDLSNLRHCHRMCNSSRQENSPTHDPNTSASDW